ncbi:MAG: glutamine-hydrolyzing GMP synthase [Candidatus Azambacteria bacterium]|nr:glutamine-hydrolyzing GMP synthase [Candidatus Azambacteria bacterium]
MIIVLNFGGQYTHLIARRLRELGIYAEILPFNTSITDIIKLKPKGIILSGSPSSVYEKNAPFPTKSIFDLNIPILGICYGQQAIAKLLGGEVRSGKLKEFGRERIAILDRANLFNGCNKKENVWFSHGDMVTKPPKGFKVIARSKACKIASFTDNNQIFGIQFHPEVTHTTHGLKILKNFIYDICREKQSWKISDIKKRLITEIKKEVMKEPVLIGVSGGVDSLVAATLLKAAIGDKLYCIFVDNGLMRKNEPREVENIFKKMGFQNFMVVNAKEKFLGALKGVVDPEKKRKIIGYTFIRVFERKAKELEKQAKIKFLAQGTIYPDRIESAQPSKNAAKIKSHHNVTLPQKLKFQIIEPIKEFYKDEVRKLGEELGLPSSFIGRHPFPGPGLAIRILGEITDKRLDILREADDIFLSELKKANLYNKIWQAFAVLLPLKTVGVMGDARTYEYIISLRAVTSIDGMTADWAKIPNKALERISSRIINETKGVNRVVYDISQKPPATIEYE